MSKKFICDFCHQIHDDDRDLTVLFLQNPYFEFFPKGIHICSSCYCALKKALSDVDVKEYILSFKDK